MKAELEVDTQGLLGVLGVIGIGVGVAPEVVKRELAAQKGIKSRKDFFRDTVRAGMKTAPGDTGVASLDMPYMAAFEEFDTDVRVGLFLLCMLEFDLRDTAYILDTEAGALAARLEQALERSERASRPIRLRLA